MRIVFAGTPPFAAEALAALVAAAPARGWTIPLVLSQPDRPSGRGMKPAASAVKALAVRHGIPVETPASLRRGEAAEGARRRLREVEPDVLVVAAYGLILPQEVLDIPAGLRRDWSPPLTAINIHASLLPRWRGAAPIARAIEAGDTETGITIMQMDAGLDTGPMLLAEPVPIAPDATAGTLTAALAALGAQLIVDALAGAGRLVATPQPEEGVTYAAKIDKAEAWLDWQDGSTELARRVRAFDPFPGASTLLRDTPVKLWSAHPVPGVSGIPGTVLGAGPDGVTIACGAGALRVTELQRAGGRRLGAREFLTGFPLGAGERCAAPSA